MSYYFWLGRDSANAAAFVELRKAEKRLLELAMQKAPERPIFRV